MKRWITGVCLALAALACDDEPASTGVDATAGEGGVGGQGDAGGASDQGGAGGVGGDAGQGGVGDDGPDPLPLTAATAPFPVPEGTAFYPDLRYGQAERNTFDLLLPEADGPTPLIIYIHGGGFRGGAKGALYARHEAEVRQWLGAGIAVGTIEYRVLQAPDTEGVAKPLGDSRYCLQFIRHHAAQLNLDPAQVALFGSSAGAGTSLWLGLGDERADPDAADPVERQSTRVQAVAALGTQATYDIMRWETDVYAGMGVTLEAIAQVEPEQADRMADFYGVPLPADRDLRGLLETPAIQAYRAQVDMLAMVDAGDPPLWFQSGGAGARPDDVGTLYHHPNHANTLRERALAEGVPVTARLPGLDIEDADFPALGDFLQQAVQ